MMLREKATSSSVQFRRDGEALRSRETNDTSLPGSLVARAKLEEVGFSSLDRADRENSPEMVVEVESPAVSPVQVRAVTVRDLVACLDQCSETANQMFVAPIRTEGEGIRSPET